MTVADYEIAECVGLWLAEGDHKSKNEVTFTNNCFCLIELFHKVMVYLYGKNVNFRPRLYSYAPDQREVETIKGISVKNYRDARANKTYYIYRFASIELMNSWKNLVADYTERKIMHIPILHGFFAGEGNIKYLQGSYVIRIAQKQPLEIITSILSQLKLKFNFSKRERSYVIWRRESWDTLAQINIAKLHPEKSKKFWDSYAKFKQYHYGKYQLKELVFSTLKDLYCTKELALIFKRTPDRLCDILMELKTENLIENFRIGSYNYWIRKDQNAVIISLLKESYLNMVADEKRTGEIAKEKGVCWKAAQRRLKELQKLDLVAFNDNKWVRKITNKRIIVRNG